MKVISRPAEMTRQASLWRRRDENVGFVPTMGALHEGHAALIRRARRENDRVVVSIFVNPTQFGPKEDLSRYPRPFAKDRALCASLGVDAIYHPTVRGMYPEGFKTLVEVGGPAELLDGRLRPGHFKGVATVVLKLLNTVKPERTYFGEKDYQQLVIVKKMAKDLDLDVQIVGCPTVRARDGLALSSRNQYLGPEERAVAPNLHRALLLARRLITARPAGLRPAGLISRLRREISNNINGVEIDYIALTDPQSLQEATRINGKLRLLAAIRIGKTRLIDNIPLSC